MQLYPYLSFNGTASRSRKVEKSLMWYLTKLYSVVNSEEYIISDMHDFCLFTGKLDFMKILGNVIMGSVHGEEG